MVKDDRGSEVVHGIDLEVRAGEILGIAGVAGNGQDELVEALVGLRKPAGGKVTLDGKDITGQGSRDVYGAGVAYVPADRHRFGLVLPFSIADNLVLTSYYRQPYARGILRNDAAIQATAEERIKEFDVRTPSADVRAATLSGGNQQKVVIAREFARDLRLLVLDQPTRGLDVGSIEFIHSQAIAKRDAGTAILLISAELDEILELSDRIAVIYRGKLVGMVDGRTADKNEVGLLMATGGRETAAAGADPEAAVDPRRTQRVTRRRARPGQRRDDDVTRGRRIWAIIALPLISIVLSVLVGSLVIIASEWLVAGQLEPGLAFKAYGALINGSVGLVQRDRQHAGVDRPAAARRPVRRSRLQGGPVQHRRPGPVPDGRPRLGHRRHPAPRVAADHRGPRSRWRPACWPARSGASSRAS